MQKRAKGDERASVTGSEGLLITAGCDSERRGNGGMIHDAVVRKYCNIKPRSELS